MNMTRFLPKVLLAAVLCFAAPAQGIDPATLLARIESGNAPTLIDVRSTSVFESGHIPGAINIPASLVPEKGLPRLGAVVVYDSGLGQDLAESAATGLNRKPGIAAEVLEGGFAAWEGARGPTTRRPGMQPEALARITYGDLKQSRGEHVILVDLRSESPPREPSPQAVNADGPALTDLRAAFPGVGAITRSPFRLPQMRQSNTQGPPPLMVLIDNGDGRSAEAAARALKANGQRRVVILAGGEEIIAREGRPGLQRLGPGQSQSDTSNQPPNIP